MLRPVKLSDAGMINDIYTHFINDTTVSFETEPLTLEQMTRRVEELSSRYPYFVYEEDGEVIGYCYVHDWKERAAYSGTMETTIYIRPGHHGKGIGKEMMDWLIRACRERGYRELIACITAENEESIAFHEHLGFTQVSRFRNVGRKFGRLLDVVDMQYSL